MNTSVQNNGSICTIVQCSADCRSTAQQHPGVGTGKHLREGPLTSRAVSNREQDRDLLQQYGVRLGDLQTLYPTDRELREAPMRMPGEHAVCPHERGPVHQCVRVQVQPHQCASRAIIPPANALHACCRHYLRLPHRPFNLCFTFTLFNLYTTPFIGIKTPSRLKSSFRIVFFL